MEPPQKQPNYNHSGELVLILVALIYIAHYLGVIAKHLGVLAGQVK